MAKDSTASNQSGRMSYNRYHCLPEWVINASSYRNIMPIKILLADDHQIMREGLAGILTKKGFTIVGEADNGHAAVELAAKLEPDVILMDVSMPDLNGVEAARQILD